MQFELIRARIDEGKAIERQSGLLRQAIINLAKVNNRVLKELEIQRVVHLIGEYIEHALALMQLIEEVASKNGILADVLPILDASEEYFLSEDDAIPDHLGLVGLVDDAYMIHSLIQAFCDRHMSDTDAKASLLPLEPHEDNLFVRRLIGEPFASLLDEHVSATLAGPGLQEYFEQILGALARLNLSSQLDPVWGSAKRPASIDARDTVLGTI